MADTKTEGSGDAKEAVGEFKDRIKKEGEHLVHHVFPVLVIELDNLLRSNKFQLERMDVLSDHVKLPPACSADTTEPGQSVSASKPCKRLRPLENGDVNNTDSQSPIPMNSMLFEMVQTVKPLIRKAIDHANTCKMWIQFLIPKIEDGNNFGVSIQEETLGQVAQSEADAATYLDQITRYFTTRAKMVSKVIKYPAIDDYRQAILELDQRQFVSMRLVVCELRNQYSALHDLILKNIEKIIKPRNHHLENMY